MVAQHKHVLQLTGFLYSPKRLAPLLFTSQLHRQVLSEEIASGSTKRQGSQSWEFIDHSIYLTGG